MRVLKPIGLPNGFVFLPVHYSHDPNKASFQWRETARAMYPRPTDFDKEMELDFQLHVGSPAYPRYSDLKHVAKGLPYEDRRPLLLAFDFNANPMSLIVCQVYREKKLLYAIKEFVYGPTTIDYVINDFRNEYAEHKSDIIVYGDSTKATNAQTAQSNWDIVRMSFRGYHVQPEIRVPPANPNVGNRLNSVNRILSGDGPVQLLIDESCVELIRDFREVILTPDGRQIYKEKDPDNPYYFRTHPSDAFGYLAFREWPTVSEIVHELAQKRQPLNLEKAIGAIDWGRKAEKAKAAVRKPIDRSRVR